MQDCLRLFGGRCTIEAPMTLRESRQRETSHRSQRILSFKQWCILNSISESTGRRLIRAGRIRVVKLSERRIGIGEDDNAAYQAAARGGA